MANAKFPFEIKEAVSQKKFEKYYDEENPHVSVGPKNYMLPKGYEKVAEDIYNMPVRPDDVFVVSSPRSGTTLTQELVWLLNNDMDFEKAKLVPLTDRYPFLEEVTFCDPRTYKAIEEAADDQTKQALLRLTVPTTETLARTPSPRFIKSHLPFSLLPIAALDTAKVVYVARDPRDVVVSLYHFILNLSWEQFKGDFKVILDQFLSGNLRFGPILEHVKEAWELRNHPNVLFLFYEDLLKDMAGCMRRVANFFDKQYTDDQFAALAEHLNIDNFKNSATIDMKIFREAGLFKGEFVRKGISKGWTEYLDEEMQIRVEKWMQEGLRGSTLRYPTQ